MADLLGFLAELAIRIIIEGLPELIFRSREGSNRSLARAKRVERLGLRLEYGSSRRLEDVVMLHGPYAGKRLSQLPLETVIALQGGWPRFVGRAAIARWLDRNSPGWRKIRSRTASPLFIPEPPAR